ncbi:T9SS type B sorting domain-containing protein [Polaribacter aestuariivivens]|uniref:T9SS type B sorting domain-containing protein n=1 Tax=Polaribacter aestuariivivens TaxID=2304626 RepID=UPI003F49987F
MKQLLFFFFLLNITFAYAQCPTPGEISLKSQEEVNRFVRDYSDCKVLNGDLTIISSLITVGDDGTVFTPITDLSQLNFLESIRGNLTIAVDAVQINNFNALTSISGDLEITSSKNLIFVSSFNNLTSVNSIVIALNPNLQTINGFSNLLQVERNLEIGRSESLLEINGFENLLTIGGELNISLNEQLIKTPSFNNLKTIGNDLNFTSNPKLNLFNGLKALEIIGNDLNIENIKTIEGFDNLKLVRRFFIINGLNTEVIPSFNKLTNIGASFLIENTSILSISGFELLENVGDFFIREDDFKLNNNTALQQVKGFLSLIFIEGNFEVTNNPNMEDCSWMCNLLNKGKVTGEVNVSNNKGDCSNIATIIEICDPDFDDDGIANIIDEDDDNDGIKDILEGSGNVDTDKDGFPDSKDLDSDNDSCFDVIEAGFEDADQNGILGNSPDTVDIRGLISGESTGYTTPSDSNNNNIFDFQEDLLPNPGKSNFIETCFNAPEIDLFNVLLGNPDRGGVWSPALSSGNSTFNPKIDVPGVYTYTQFDPLCGARSAQIEVKFPSNLRAGISVEILSCKEKGIINLFDELEGNPTPGGKWEPQLVGGGDFFNPDLDKEGTYTYTIDDKFCGKIKADVTIKVSSKPNTGVNSKLTICELSNKVNLFDVLEGNPDSGGTWTYNNLLVSNILDPSTATSGIYTYTIDNGVCGSSSSNVEVDIIKNATINNVNIVVNDFSSKNNSITINIFSTREYEYSLDGISYQNENTFNNLNGGKQTIFVKGKDGCEFYQETIFIKTYPVFFSPNSDGVNDFWQLNNFPEDDYQIFIYNRFGRLIKQLNTRKETWDGTENGKLLSSSNYWFKVLRKNGEVLFGNFSLIRK